MHTFLNILLYLGAAGIGYIFKDLTSGYLIEKGKNTATKQDIEEITHKIEGIKVQFFEHQTHYSLFHEKRFEVLGKTYELIHDPFEYIKNMVHPLQYGGEEDEKKRRELAFDAFNKLSGYYWKHKIYLSEDICADIEDVLDLMKDAASKYRIARDQGDDAELWQKSYKTMKNKVPKLREKLESKFREEISIPSYHSKEDDA